MTTRLSANRLTVALTVLSTALMLQACGGGGGNSGGGGGDGGSPSVDSDAQTVWVSTQFIPEEGQGGDGDGGDGDGDGGIGAGGSLGKFNNASVEVFDSSQASVGSAPVGANGFVAIQPPADYSGPIMTSVIGDANSTYFDEAKLSNLNTGAGTILTARVPATDRTFGITPLTHGAAAFDEERNRTTGGTLTRNSIEVSNAAMLTQINRFLPADQQLTDILQVPVLVDSAQSLSALTDTPAGRYARAIASFAIAAQKFNPSLANPAQAFTLGLANDMTDGVIDNRDVNGQPIAPAATLPYQSTELKTALAAAFDEIEAGQNPTTPTNPPPGPLFPSADVCAVTIVTGGQVYTSVGIRTEKINDGYIAYCSHQTGQSSPMEFVRLVFAVEADDPNYISEFCGLRGDAVVRTASDNPPFYVAFSTRRQVAADITLPNIRNVPLAVMRRAVEAGVGRPCP
ncbi:MAG: hypothetical protein AB8C46_01660 [Burkholderiaceae bacterium]